MNINTEGPLNLMVAWGVGGKVHGRTINVGGGVADALRDAAQQTVASMDSGHPYDPDADMEDNSHLEASREELLDTDLVETLERGHELALATEDEIRSRRLSCYAAAIGNGPGRAIFIRKTNPVSLATKSVVARLFDGTLDRVSEPLLAFDNRYDAILTSTTVYVLDKNRFEGMFRDSAAVLAKAADWVDELATDLPITAGSKDELVGALERNSHYRSKVHAILRRPHVKTLTVEVLAERMEAHGLDVNTLMPGGSLDFRSENIKPLLQLLNDDLFEGDFSKEQFAAGSKRRRS